MLKTPLDEEVSENDLEELGRVECPVCHLAVLEDEMAAEGKCLLCILREEGW